MGRPSLLALSICVALVAPARAIVIYESLVGYNFANGGSGAYYGGQGVEPSHIGGDTTFSRGGALCPTPDTPDYVCGQHYSEAGVEGQRVFLKSEARLTRKQAIGLGAGNSDYLIYGDSTLTIHNIGSSVSLPSGIVYFVFGLHGTASTATSSGQVLSQATGVASLSGTSNEAIQCAGFPCPPIVVKQSGVNFATGNDISRNSFRLNLRADARAGAPYQFGPYDAEMIADFRDTLELLAIIIHDPDDNPVPGAHAMTFKADNTPELVFDNTIPPTTTTPDTTSSTTTTQPGGGSTTTTLPGSGGCAASPSYAGLVCRIDALAALVGTSDVGKLGKALSKTLAKAKGGVAKAEQSGDASSKKHKKALRKAHRALTAYGRKLESKGAVKQIEAATRTALAAPVSGLLAEVAGLGAS